MSSSLQPFKQLPNFKSHHGRANRVFCDGHVENEDMRQTFSASDPELRRWNNDNLPHADLVGQ